VPAAALICVHAQTVRPWPVSHPLAGDRGPGQRAGRVSSLTGRGAVEMGGKFPRYPGAAGF
jgi:hypothetical protein